MVYKVFVLLWKDLLIESRRPLEFVSAIVFAISAASFSGYVASRYAIDDYTLQAIIGSSLILIQLFLAVFTAIMGFVREADRGTLYGLKALPIGSETMFFSKLLFTLILLETFSFIALTSSTFFSGAGLNIFLSMFFIIAVSAIYFSAVAAFSSALAVYIEARSLLIPTIVLALSAPYAQNVISNMMMYTSLGSIALLTLSGVLLAILATWLSQFVFE
ncbi:MAG: ABC transporter permease [Acidilobaceae archaeon]